MYAEKRKFAAFDIDGTLFRWQLFHSLVFELREFLPDSTNAELRASFNAWEAREGKWRDYEHAIIAAFRNNITAIPPSEFDSAVERVMQRSGKKLYVYTRTLVQKLKAEGYFLIALSGSQQEAAERFGAQYGFDVTIGTVYERSPDGFSGDVSSDAFTDKGVILKKLAVEHGLTFDGSWAVGDSHNDITMLSAVDHPIAFNPTDDLYKIATDQDWPIVIERKNLAYRLEKGPDGSYVLAQTEIF